MYLKKDKIIFDKEGYLKEPWLSINNSKWRCWVDIQMTHNGFTSFRFNLIFLHKNKHNQGENIYSSL